MERRTFLKATGMAALAADKRIWADPTPRPDRPNVLLIITDQQFADAMSCAIGREHIHTPNMDSLAENGVRFTHAYCANPLCVPSRAAMFTGRYPHETAVQTNSAKAFRTGQFACMGTIFRSAGYDTGFFGKWHMPFRPDRLDDHGFAARVDRPAFYSGAAAAAFIGKRRSGPFLAVASFVNPHNICEWSRGQELPGGPIGDPPPPDKCPPLKPNMAPPANETDIMAHMRRSCQAHRLFPVGAFTDEKWRQYLWAYYRLIEKVDRRVGTVLDALRKAEQEQDTVVVFLSDHGECHGVHRWNQKTVFYDESARVPFIASRKGATPKGTSDVLVNTGVDLIPTLCDLAGLEVPEQLPGTSLKRWALGDGPDAGRPCVVASNKMVQCEPVEGVLYQPDGRMVRSRRHKYCLYGEGKRRESLVDMAADPGETTNLAGEAKARDVLAAHRAHLRSFARKHGDAVALAMLEGL